MPVRQRRRYDINNGSIYLFLTTCGMLEKCRWSQDPQFKTIRCLRNYFLGAIISLAQPKAPATLAPANALMNALVFWRVVLTPRPIGASSPYPQ